MSSVGHETDVFVIGGGPAGLAAAIAARRKGFRVTLADALRPPIDKSCGEGLMPDALHALGQLGIAIPAAGSCVFRGIRFVGSGISIAAAFPSGLGIGVRRTTLHQVLVEQAGRCGVTLLWGTNVDGLDAIRARWIIGADGCRSRVRRWAGLDASGRDSHRFGFRRHYRIAPWTDCMEIHWGSGCQLYVTPVAPDEVCVVVISRNPHLRLDEALVQFPEIRARVDGAASYTAERGAITPSRKLHAVHRGRVALIGDASGSVDAITGDGLCMSFQQALALADALEHEDLAQYQAAHRHISRRPQRMSALMLALDRWPRLRSRVFRAMSAKPELFGRMLAMHVGALAPFESAATGAVLGWRMLRG